jgi:hypothetical protein
MIANARIEYQKRAKFVENEVIGNNQIRSCRKADFRGRSSWKSKSSTRNILSVGITSFVVFIADLGTARLLFTREVHLLGVEHA